MTSAPDDRHDPTGGADTGAAGPGGPQGFGEQAGEMTAETEVETPLDTSTNSDMLEEGGPVDATHDDSGDGLDGDPGAEIDAARTALAERTLDLQRLQAEYLNYKRRVERDRELTRENATYAALTPIVEVLDTVDRAREHEPLEGGFKSVAEQLERTVAGLGLTRFGEPGDAFDPTLHEALSHLGTDPEVTVTTCKLIAKAGYRIGDRVVRAAQVLVVDPA